MALLATDAKVKGRSLKDIQKVGRGTTTSVNSLNESLVRYFNFGSFDFIDEADLESVLSRLILTVLMGLQCTEALLRNK